MIEFIRIVYDRFLSLVTKYITIGSLISFQVILRVCVDKWRPYACVCREENDTNSNKLLLLVHVIIMMAEADVVW